jgi:hypothetical protein
MSLSTQLRERHTKEVVRKAADGSAPPCGHTEMSFTGLNNPHLWPMESVSHQAPGAAPGLTGMSRWPPAPVTLRDTKGVQAGMPTDCEAGPRQAGRGGAQRAA